jgi:pSer/pThr/pTyr-binding forkhead associated (FHA) protein
MLKLRFVNKEHGDVWLVEPSVLIGTDTACQVALKHDGVKPRHADIQIKGSQLTLVNLANDVGLTVNGKTVNKDATITTGDEISVAGMKIVVVDPKDERKVATETQATSVWAIRPNHSALANKIYSINGDTVLGRATECDLSFSVAHMSRKHAQLSIVNGQLFVKDLDSANGTFVNGKQVKESKLQKGDELRLDTLSFTVIGPGGDSDKTTVRMAVSIPPAAKVAAPAPVAPQTAAKPASAPASAQSTNASAAPQEKRRPAGMTTFQKAVVANEEAKVQAKTESNLGMVVGIAVLAVLSALVAYMFIG